MLEKNEPSMENVAGVTFLHSLFSFKTTMKTIVLTRKKKLQYYFLTEKVRILFQKITNYNISIKEKNMTRVLQILFIFKEIAKSG